MLHNTNYNKDHGEDRKCAMCSFTGNTAHDLTWDENLDQWVHSDLCGDIALLSEREAKQALKSMYLYATHHDCPQWLRDSAIAILHGVGATAKRRYQKRRDKKGRRQ